MAKIENLETLQRLDHDVLSNLSGDFKNFIKQYEVDIKELKDATNTRINDHEGRIRVIEKTMDEAKPLIIAENTEKLAQDYRDFKRNWKAAQTLVIMISAVTGYILAQVSNVLHIIK